MAIVQWLTITAIGDTRLFLQKFTDAQPASRAMHESWITQLRARDQARETEIDRQAAAMGEHVSPIALCRAIDDAAADDAVLVADSGDFVATASYVLHPRAGSPGSTPACSGRLAWAGFSLGAKLYRPQSEVWILYGDTACGYGTVEFDTFVCHGIPVIAMVGYDAGRTQIAHEQEKLLKDDVATALTRSAYDDVAAGFGATGLRVHSMAGVPGVLADAPAAHAAGRPKNAQREGQDSGLSAHRSY